MRDLDAHLLRPHVLVRFGLGRDRAVELRRGDELLLREGVRSSEVLLQPPPGGLGAVQLTLGDQQGISRLLLEDARALDLVRLGFLRVDAGHLLPERANPRLRLGNCGSGAEAGRASPRRHRDPPRRRLRAATRSSLPATVAETT